MRVTDPVARAGPSIRPGRPRAPAASLPATVLQVSSVAGGSTGRIACALARAVDEAGGRAWVAYGRGGASAGPPRELRIGGRLDAWAHAALTRVRDRHGLGSRRATRAFVERVRAIAPDVVHLHNLHGYYVNFELLFELLRAADVPVVWTLHDCWAFTGHCPYYDRIACDRWRTGCARCPQRREYPASWVADASAQMFERKRRAFTSVRRMCIVTPSRWLAGEVQRSFLRDYPVRVIPNGIDLAAFAPRPTAQLRARLGIAERTPVVLGVGGAHPRKGMAYLVELARRLWPDAAVVMVGVPRERLRELPPGLVCAGRVEGAAALAEYYALASAFVNPTLEDNFPTVNLEALAAGAPVVTFATGGCAEQISAETGRSVAARDLDGLERAVREVIAKGRSHFEVACCREAKRYSVANMADAYLRVYRELLV